MLLKSSSFSNWVYVGSGITGVLALIALIGSMYVHIQRMPNVKNKAEKQTDKTNEQFAPRGSDDSKRAEDTSDPDYWFLHESSPPVAITPPTTIPLTPPPTPKPVQTTLTSAEIAKHNTSGNCWLLISGKVYDVTQYIPFHPGGQNRIIPYCGKEATTAFNTKAGAGSHSTLAHNLLAGYLVGTLGNPVPPPAPKPTPPPATTPPPAQNPPPTTTTLTTATVATHNSGASCWLIISNNVYDVTQYIPFHPGGQSRILTYCGQDATTAFNTRGGTGSHSTNAHTILSGYRIGALGSSATLTPPQPGITPPPLPPQQDDD